MPSEHALCTTREVAELLDVTAATVSRWARDGRLPVITLPSGQMRFRRSDVEAIMQPTSATEAAL